MRRATFALVFAIACGSSAPPPAPTVATAEPVRGGFALEREDFTWNVTSDTRAEEGSVAQTAEDGRGALRLDSGAWVLLDRNTSLTLRLDQIELQQGRVWIDAKDTSVEVVTRKGTLRATDATFAIDGREDVEVYCGSGELSYVAGDNDGRVAQGETLTFADEPNVNPAELWDDWTGGLADPSPDAVATAGYIGILAGRTLQEYGKARRPLALRAHEVDAAVQGEFAATEVVQTFFNAESQALEAEYRFHLPENAIVQSFAIDLGGGFVDAEVQPLMNERGYGLSWANASVATSRLSYDGPGRLRARVHPVEPGATVRIKVRYTEWLARRGDTRRYVYPMTTEQQPPLVGELRIRVNTAEANAGAYRAGMGARVEDSAVIVRRSDWRPTSDFHLDLIDREDAENAEGAKAYVVDAPPGATDDQRFVLFDLPTASADEETPPSAVDLVVLVDVSASAEDEDLELARAVVESILQQLTPEDRVRLRVGDVNLRVGTAPEEHEAILAALSEVEAGGATDLATMLRDAATLAAETPQGAVLYVGDALPTTGAMDATEIRRTLATLDTQPRFFGVAVGHRANRDLLRALFGDSTRKVTERTGAARVVMRMLADAARPMLRNVQVDLGSGIERMYPRPPLVSAVGERLRIVGRVLGDLPTEVQLRGTLQGETIERTLPIARESIVDEGDIRRRWATARLAELIDEDAGREALVELGTRYEVLTPWTSLVAIGGKVEADWLGAPSGYPLVTGFDEDPRSINWALGGGTARIAIEDNRGWRRRRQAPAEAEVVSIEETWASRVTAGDDNATGDGGLPRAAVLRALRTSERGPRACYERKLLVRPDLAGNVLVDVEVDGSGGVRNASIASSSLREGDVEGCILAEVRGVRFPSTGGTTVRVQHLFRFASSGRGFGIQRRCSDASRQSLEVRERLWRERLAANAGPGGALSVWREALRQCELNGWTARRALLRRMLRHVGSTQGRLRMYDALSGDAAARGYLRRAILRSLRTPQEVVLARRHLGLGAGVEWKVFSRLWKRAGNPEARLRLVRQWMEVAPEDIDLRLRLMTLLEELGRAPEAARVARELRRDPLADARVRAAIAEYWKRQGDDAQAFRTLSEIVEFAPRDPWARRRLGDLYRAHDLHEHAYREYRTLARLRPANEDVLLLLARAAAGAGRIDEALRLEQRLSESQAPGEIQGAGAVARLWTTARLAAMKADASPDELRRIRRRERSTGVLRNPPAVLVLLTWAHPEDQPELHLNLPSTPEGTAWERAAVSSSAFGLEAHRVQDREEGPIRVEVRRANPEGLRDWSATLTVIEGLGTGGEQIHRRTLTLSRTAPNATFRLEGGTFSP
ncbi:MAG: AgmX/PglI C-terminal domain-containing protein [Myxococcota bacterium]